jgi:hypothetical protein
MEPPMTPTDGLARPNPRAAAAQAKPAAAVDALHGRPWRLLPASIALVLCCAALVLGLAPRAALAAATEGSGRAATESRAPGAFDAIAVAGSIDVRVRPSATPAVRVTADDNLVGLVETEVEDGAHGRTLRIALRRGERVRPRTPIRVVVDAVTLRAVALSGSGDLALERFETPALALSISGAGDAVLRDLHTGALSVRIAGSGDVRAGGRADEATLSIAGSGDADLSALSAGTVEVSIAGSGDADVTAERSLKVRIAGSGDVRYGGGATEVRSSVVGSGSVRAR